MEDTAKTILSQVESEHDLTLRGVMRLLGRSRAWVENHAQELGLYWVQGTSSLQPVPMFSATAIQAWRESNRAGRATETLKTKGVPLSEVLAERKASVALQADFTLEEVATMLGRSTSWVSKKRDLFQHYYVPGRGKIGKELRFTRKSVLEYVESLRAQANGGADQHETVDQIISRVKSKRAAAGQSL